jgi:DNA-binding transcriptional regulator YhcF (GntR family)
MPSSTTKAVRGSLNAINVTVDEKSTAPPFEQVRAQIAAQIADGVLVAGTRLPTVRRLADDLGLAVNTVARSYRELEAAGIVETRGRGGTVVTAGGDQARAKLLAAAHKYAALAHDLGVSAEEALRLAAAALDPTDVQP